jgi:hypothetical protein
MKRKAYKNLRYRPNERKKMLEAGFPLCYRYRHCNSCIKMYRLINKKK